MPDINELIEKIKSNSAAENKALAQSLGDSLDSEKSAALKGLLSNSDALKRLLESDAAKELMKKLGGDKNGA